MEIADIFYRQAYGECGCNMCDAWLCFWCNLPCSNLLLWK